MKKSTLGADFSYDESSNLFFEDEEFVTDEVPDEREARGEELSDDDPVGIGDAEHRLGEGRDDIDDTTVDADANEADDEELREFERLLLGSSFVLERPELVHEVAIHDGDREGNSIQDDDADTASDASDSDEDTENDDIDTSVDAADDDELGELLDGPDEPFLRETGDFRALYGVDVHRSLLRRWVR